MLPFVGFFPDADDHTEGVITNVEMMVPTLRGYKGAPSLVPQTAALSAACRGAVAAFLLDNTNRLFAGTQTKLYELSGTTWSDVTAAAGDYVGSADSVWRFAQFGNITLAVNGTDATQKSITTGVFSALAGAPKAYCIDTVAGFVFLANYNDGSAVKDGVFWSAYQDYTIWTPSAATQCGNLRLLDTPGEIRALKGLQKYAVAYKENSIYLGVNTESNLLWGFNLVSDKIGTYSHEAVVKAETSHYFIGSNGIYQFTAGSIPQAIDDGIRDWFLADLNKQFAYKIRGVYDKLNSLIFWYYPSTGSSTLDSCLVYHVKTRKWSRANRSIEVCLELITPAQTYAGLLTAYATYAVIPSVTYGGSFWNNLSTNMAVVSTDHMIYTLTGVSSSSSITSGTLGDDMQFTLLKRVQPRFVNDADSGTMTNYYRLTDGSSYVTDNTVDMSSNRFDVLRSARWHKVKTSYTGDVEVIGNSYLLAPSGVE